MSSSVVWGSAAVSWRSWWWKERWKEPFRRVLQGNSGWTAFGNGAVKPTCWHKIGTVGESGPDGSGHYLSRILIGGSYPKKKKSLVNWINKAPLCPEPQLSDCAEQQWTNWKVKFSVSGQRQPIEGDFEAGLEDSSISIYHRSIKSISDKQLASYSRDRCHVVCAAVRCTNGKFSIVFFNRLFSQYNYVHLYSPKWTGRKL